jgi:hypothetical protein
MTVKLIRVTADDMLLGRYIGEIGKLVRFEEDGTLIITFDGVTDYVVYSDMIEEVEE